MVFERTILIVPALESRQQELDERHQRLLADQETLERERKALPAKEARKRSDALAARKAELQKGIRFLFDKAALPVSPPENDLTDEAVRAYDAALHEGSPP